MKQTDAVKKLSALAHDGRLSLFRRLIEAGPDGEAAGDLARFAGIGPTTASAQLTILSNAGLVAARRDGRSILYRVDYEVMRDLLVFLVQDCCRRRGEICSPVARLLEAAKDAFDDDTDKRTGCC